MSAENKQQDSGILGWVLFGIGFLGALFVGWFYGKGKTWKEISNNGKLKVGYLNIFMFLIKYIAPIAIALVFMHGLGIIKF